MTLSVLVPHLDGLVALSALDGVRPLLYEPDRPLPDRADEAEILVVRGRVDDSVSALFPRLPRLRMVQTLSASAEAWQSHVPAGVALFSAHGAYGGPAAEWAVGALVCIAREFPRFAASQAAHAWIRPAMTETLEGKRVLILGAGELGTSLQERLVPLGASVTMAARTARHGVRSIAEVPQILGEHDAVVVMVSSNGQTRGLVNKDFLARMPDDAILVNVTPGPVVDTMALLAELRTLRLRAALDVTDPEPLPSDHPLWSAPNVLITPHVAGFTAGRSRRVWEAVASRIAAYAADGWSTGLASSAHSLR
jgi:phosphoglycerate dehydrogenase-like enzyme